MLSTRRVFISFLLLSAVVLSGCDTIIDALFGQTVPVNRSDVSPPTVRLLVADVYVKDPHPGDFIVTNSARTAWVEPSIMITVSADDPQGVKFVQLDNITVEPMCSAVPMGRDGRPPAPPSYTRAPAVTVTGDINGLPDSSPSATTRITLIKRLTIVPRLHTVSGYCPADRPQLGGATIRLRARAGNFGRGVAQTQVATLTLTRPSGNIIVGAPSSGGSGTPPATPACAGEGNACTTHPTQCDGRGAGWTAPGTIECVSGAPVCISQPGVNFCTACGQTVDGASCGNCEGQSCRSDADCAVTGVCDTLSAEGGHCRGFVLTACPAGTAISGLCWQPSENTNKTLACP